MVRRLQGPIGKMATRRIRSAMAVVGTVIGVSAVAMTSEGDALAGPQAAAPRAASAATKPSLVASDLDVEASPSKGLRGAETCPSGMVEIEGDYCPQLEQKCVKWMDLEGTVRRCAEFAPSSACKVATIKKRFCIDRFEYPNRQGERPVVMKNWYEAAAACKADGKRLCGDSEWTLACEGQERSPYPYGTKRDANACNIDKPHRDVNEKAIANPETRDAEVARLWQGEPSGARTQCTSSYGVFDMTGNVDEWVVNESGRGFKSGLKGGYWGPVRDRCRPMTTAHSEDFSFYQIGFRCCADTAEVEVAAGPARAGGQGARASR